MQIYDHYFFADEDDPSKTLFKNVVIYVNGWTYPTAGMLQTLMQLAGGGFSWSYEAKRTTHTISTVLSMAQKRRERDRLTTVKPEWILDSLAARKVLPIHEYKVCHMKALIIFKLRFSF